MNGAFYESNLTTTVFPNSPKKFKILLNEYLYMWDVLPISFILHSIKSRLASLLIIVLYMVGS